MSGRERGRGKLGEGGRVIVIKRYMDVRMSDCERERKKGMRREREREKG